MDDIQLKNYHVSQDNFAWSFSSFTASAFVINLVPVTNTAYLCDLMLWCKAFDILSQLLPLINVFLA